MSDDGGERWDIDADLLMRFRRGEPGSAEQLYARHGPAVIRFFRNKAQTEHYEDLAQEALTRLFDNLDEIRDGRKVRAYAIQIARNVLLEHLRKLSRARRFDPETDAIADVQPGVGSLVATKNEVRLLLAGLRRLPLDTQILLERVYIEGVSSVAMARELDIPDSTVRGRVARARAQLVHEIAQLEASGPLIASTIENLDDWARDIRERAGQLTPADADG